MLGRLSKFAARPMSAATGATGVLAAVFAVLREFNLGMTSGQESAVLMAVAVVSNYVIAVTGSAALRRVLGDPDIPTIDQSPSGAHAAPDGLAPVRPAPPGEWGE